MKSDTSLPVRIELVIASTNIHKIRELKEMLKSKTQLDVRTLLDFPSYTPPSNAEGTFEQRAQFKALHAAAALNKWVIADDSGLFVPSLGISPIIFCIEGAEEHPTDADLRKKLLEQMRHLLEEDRYAYFESYLALASSEGVKKCVRGVCEGAILLQEKGGGGFGYDPLFVKHGYSRTFAELEESIKNRISHRRKAFDKLLTSLEGIFTLQ